MTKDEAIKYLQMDLLKPGSVLKLEFQDAEQLGIEALKVVKWLEENQPDLVMIPLPGETKK